MCLGIPKCCIVGYSLTHPIGVNCVSSLLDEFRILAYDYTYYFDHGHYHRLTSGIRINKAKLFMIELIKSNQAGKYKLTSRHTIQHTFSLLVVSMDISVSP